MKHKTPCLIMIKAVQTNHVLVLSGGQTNGRPLYSHQWNLFKYITARQKGTVSPKRKEKASHNMFIMLFVSLINDHVNYEEGFSKVGLKKWHLNGTNTFCLKIHGCSRFYISTLIKS